MADTSSEYLTNLGLLWEKPSSVELKPYEGRLNFRSLAEMDHLILRNLHRISGKFDFVVGIPRSGLLAASIIALHLNIPLLTINELASGQFSNTYSSRKIRTKKKPTSDTALRVLVVDDSVNTGKALTRVRSYLEGTVSETQVELEFLAIYAVSACSSLPDYFFEILEHPRVFEWNIMHHGYSPQFLLDLDGIICLDGPPENSHDGGRYLSYITNASLKIRPTHKVGAIVTSRLEKYRSVTVEWLERNGVEYGQLIMLNLKTPEERRALAIHGKYKADVYKTLGGMLFIESEEWQARQIALITKKPVYWLDRALMITA